MKARCTIGDDHDIWMCWVPEIQRMVHMDDYVIYDEQIFIGMELHPDMLNRKTKYKWEITSIDNNEHEHICNRIHQFLYRGI